MPKGSPELTEARREEIINACEKLYQTMSFKEITIKEIGNATSFTRTSIYNYFQTKEEIFLALLKREYELWIASLREEMERHEQMTKDEFADMLAHSLEKRAQLLKIMSMNHYDMETGSRPEHLTDFKVVYGESICTVESGLDKYFPDMAAGEKRDFIYTFFPFMFGMSTFIENYDFSGKTVIPFCTSGSSGFGNSDSALRAAASGATWLDGHRFSAGASADDVLAWANGLEIN